MENDNIVTLLDENGGEVEYEFLDFIDYEDAKYAVLLPVEEQPGEEGMVAIMRVREEDGEEYLECVEDDDLLDAVFAIFMERNADEFDFEETEDDE